MQAIRIRDLEQRIQVLERARCDEQMEICRLQRELDESMRSKADQAKDVWLELGRQMGFAAQQQQQQQAQPQRLHELLTGPSFPAVPTSSTPNMTPAHLAPSPHVKIDPQALPGGVARSIARPPVLGIDSIAEDREEGEDISMHMDHNTHDVRPTPSLHHPHSLPSSSSWSSSSLPASTRVTKRDGMRGKRSSGVNAAATTSRLPPTDTHHTSYQPRTIPDAISPTSSPPSLPPATPSHASMQEQDGPPSPTLQDHEMVDRAPSPTPAPPSSTVDDETGALRITDLTLQSPTPLHTTPSSAEPSSSSSPSSPAVSRKRKTTSPSDIYSSQTEADQHQTEAIAELANALGSEPTHDDDDQEQVGSTRMSRRSSVRARASVNYALPKLNTKMRKPDPEELKPAKPSKSRASTKMAAANSNGDLKDLKKSRSRPPSVESTPTPKKRSVRSRGGDEDDEDGGTAEKHVLQMSTSTNSSIDDDTAEADETVTPAGGPPINGASSSTPAAVAAAPLGESLSELFHVDRDARRGGDNFQNHRDNESRDTTDDERENEETSGSEVDLEDVEVGDVSDDGNGDTTASPRPRPAPAAPSTSSARRPSRTAEALQQQQQQRQLPRTSSTTSRLTDSTAASRNRSAANESTSAARRRSSAAASSNAIAAKSSSTLTKKRSTSGLSSASSSSSTAPPSTASSSGTASPALLASLGLPTTEFSFGRGENGGGGGGGGDASHHTVNGKSSATAAPANGSAAAGSRKVAALRKLSVNGSGVHPQTQRQQKSTPSTTASQRMGMKVKTSTMTSTSTSTSSPRTGENIGLPPP